MLTIANLQGNSNQTTMSCHLTPVKWLSLKKNKNNKIINIIKDMEKKEPSYTVGGNVSWCGCCGKTVWGFLKKIKILE